MWDMLGSSTPKRISRTPQGRAFNLTARKPEARYYSSKPTGPVQRLEVAAKQAFEKTGCEPTTSNSSAARWSRDDLEDMLDSVLRRFLNMAPSKFFKLESEDGGETSTSSNAVHRKWKIEASFQRW